MQPYLFPYLGYFQLINSVDCFVIYDDVNYIKRGWINRNYCLAGNGKQLFTLPLKKASQNKLINQIELLDSHKILKILRHAYIKAPYFNVVYSLIEEIFEQTEKNLVNFLYFQLNIICKYLQIKTRFQLSSKLNINNEMRGQKKILSICENLNASHYINASGGYELYCKKFFLERGIKLSFIESRTVFYPQFSKEFVPNLSIIDVLMFNDRVQCVSMLKEYDLV